MKESKGTGKKSKRESGQKEVDERVGKDEIHAETKKIKEGI